MKVDNNNSTFVWREMDQESLDAAYEQSNYASNLQEVVDRYQSNSEKARHETGEPKRFQYGPKDIEQLDVYSTAKSNAPIIIFVHGGAWRIGFAKDYAFPAPLFTKAGIHWIAIDFDSVLDVEGDLTVLAGQVRRAIAWVYNNANKFSGNKDNIYLCGHSSGAHLTAVCLTTDWQSGFNLPSDIIKGGLCCSGMYDLEPVRLSSRSEYLNITEETENRLSPQRHLDKLIAPVIISHGTNESPEFVRQSNEFAQAIENVNKTVDYVIGIDLNHFEILETLADQSGLLAMSLLKMIQKNSG